MNTGIDALVDTITSMDIGQITDYNKIVIERIAYRAWTLELTDGPITVEGSLCYAPSINIVEPGMQEVHIEQYQYEAHAGGERTCGYCPSFREAWKEVLNSMQEIADQH